MQHGIRAQRQRLCMVQGVRGIMKLACRPQSAWHPRPEPLPARQAELAFSSYSAGYWYLPNQIVVLAIYVSSL